MWVQTYKPKRLEDIAGYDTVVNFVRRYDWRKPLLFYGESGVGKSLWAEAISNEFNFDLVEVTAENIGDVLNIANTSSFFGNMKLISIDDVDELKKGGISEVGEDDNGKAGGRSGVGIGRTLAELLKTSKNPVVLTTSDLKKIKRIVEYCEKIQLKRPHPASIVKYLEKVCAKENITTTKEVLKAIAEKSQGDFRSALNDLETIAKGRKSVSEKDLDALGLRDTVKEDVYKALSTIFGGKKLDEVIESTWDLDEKPDNIMLWIDENLPRIYTTHTSISKAYYYLSRADIFIGRITARQYWGFLRYANAMMTAGVNTSKEKVVYGRYMFPSYFISLSKIKKENSLKKSIAQKMSRQTHVSKKVFAREYVPLIKTLVRSGKITPEILEEFRLDSDETEYLTN